jgi:hypothetical protein
MDNLVDRDLSPVLSLLSSDPLLPSTSYVVHISVISTSHPSQGQGTQAVKSSLLQVPLGARDWLLLQGADRLPFQDRNLTQCRYHLDHLLHPGFLLSFCGSTLDLLLSFWNPLIEQEQVALRNY